MFKKTLCVITLLIMVLCMHCNALAESCPLPEVNTTKEIYFSGFEWYSDFDSTLATAKAKGFVNEYDWSREHFDAEMFLTPHWHTILNSINAYAGSEQGCGGYLNYTSDIPKVAGYRISELKLYLMWNEEVGAVSDYKAKDAMHFYMAKYTFDVSDKKAAYEDIVSKLKKLYGNDPYVSTYGYSGLEYTVWVNEKQALIGISCDNYDVELVYMAPGAEEKLIQVEKMMKQQEIDNAAGDFSGL